MKSITKYISLLTIALLAVSALGVCQAADTHNNKGEKTLIFKVGKALQINETDLNAVKKAFEEAGLNESEFYSVDKQTHVGITKEFITFKKQPIPLTTVYSTEVDYNWDTGDATYDDFTYHIVVY